MKLMGPMSIIVVGAAMLVGSASFTPQLALPASQSAMTDQPDFQAVLRAHPQILGTVTSDTEALTLFASRLGPALDLTDSVSILTSKSLAGRLPDGTTSDLADAAIRLTAELAAWRHATAIKQAADTEGAAPLQAVLKDAVPQQQWLLGNDGRVHLRRAFELAALLTAVQSPQASQSNGSPIFAEYAAYLDRTYPRLTGPDSSWLAVAEREGLAGLRRRLMEFWEQSGRQGTADKEDLASRYVHTRLRPVFLAQLTAHAILAEADAESRARAQWVRLRTWRDRLREMKGLARLCGTWQWTVHNHQNHQEHKMVMTFSPPNAPDTSGPRPTKIVVLGDGVYLRWEFQGGYQEDSLLFTNEGQRLEGSFINSAGAWGSIAGKRTAACSR